MSIVEDKHFSLISEEIPSCKIDKKLLQIIEQQISEKLQIGKSHYLIELKHSDSKVLSLSSINQYTHEKFHHNLMSIKIRVYDQKTNIIIDFSNHSLFGCPSTGSIGIKCQGENAESQSYELQRMLLETITQYRTSKIEVLHKLLKADRFILSLIVCLILVWFLLEKKLINQISPLSFFALLLTLFISFGSISTYTRNVLYPYFQFDINPDASLSQTSARLIRGFWDKYWDKAIWIFIVVMLNQVLNQLIKFLKHSN